MDNTEKNYTEFIKAIEAGQGEKVNELLESGVSVNNKNEDGKTPIMLAVLARELDIVNLLVDAGADVNAKDRDGNTALILMASQEFVRLADVGEALKSTTRLDFTLTESELKELAAKVGVIILAIFSKLKGAGVDLEIKNKHGHTALHLAEKGNVADFLRHQLDA